MNNDKLKVAVIGASGYTGIELIRILLNHRKVILINLVASSNADKNISEIYPHLSEIDLPKLERIEDVNFQNIDLVFCCLPHTTSQKIIKELLTNKDLEHLKVIDLSADYRLRDTKDYEEWYKNKHISSELQKEAVYGLTEFNREKIKKARLIACPGCYPTSTLLPLIPLLESNAIDNNNIVIDSKSGVSGAGRSLKENLLFSEVNESLKAYSISEHRHIIEIEQELKKASNQNNLKISFTPHLVPITRGILSTIYVTLKESFRISDIKNILKTKFEDEYFVQTVKHYPSIKEVSSTNFCKIAIFPSRIDNQIIIISVIDNLTKGSSGQAVQNMNILFNLDEREGLDLLPIFP